MSIRSQEQATQNISSDTGAYLGSASHFLRNFLSDREVSRSSFGPSSFDLAGVYDRAGHVSLRELERQHALATRHVQHATTGTQQLQTECRGQEIEELQTTIH